MIIKMKKGFSMIELLFVIIIIGILSVVALPNLLETRSQALIGKGKATLYSVRGSISAENQNRFMNGDSTAINNLSSTGMVFSVFNADSDGIQNKVLQYPVKSCTTAGCWSGSGTSYKFHLPEGGTCTYTLSAGLLTTTGCSQLEK